MLTHKIEITRPDASTVKVITQHDHKQAEERTAAMEALTAIIHEQSALLGLETESVVSITNTSLKLGKTLILASGGILDAEEMREPLEACMRELNRVEAFPRAIVAIY